jgi:hypothetical protein
VIRGTCLCIFPKPSYIRSCSNINPNAAKISQETTGNRRICRESEGPFSTTRIYESTVKLTETKQRKNPGMGSSSKFQSSFSTDAGLRALVKGCPDLRTVSLKKCVEVTHVGLSQPVRSCLHLESLNLTDCLGI